MRFTIHAEAPLHGLRIIEEIPNHTICRIEGRNGIGKSLAIRLLQLATGDQPFSGMPKAWDTLRQNLGRLIIEAQGLRDGETITWHIDSRTWPKAPEPVEDWVAAMRLNSQPANLKQIASLLRVFRIGGDETLIESIVLRIRADSEATRRLISRIEPIVLHLDNGFASLQSLLSTAEPDRLVDIASEIPKLSAQLSSLSPEAIRLESDRTRLREAIGLRDAVRAFDHDAPALEVKIQELNDLIARLDAEMKQLGEKRDTVQAAAAVRLHGIHSQIQSAESQVKQAAERFADATARADQHATKLHMESDLPSVKKARVAAEEEASALHRFRISLDSIPALQSLMTRIEYEVRSGLTRGLSQETLAILDDDREVRAVELLASIQRARSRLAGRQRDPQLADLDKRLASLQARVSHLQQLERSISARERAQRDLREAETRLEEARAPLADAEDPEYKSLSVRIGEIQTQSVDAIIQRAQHVQRLKGLTGGRSKATLQRHLSKLLASDLSEETLDSALRQVEAAHASITKQIDAVTQRISELKIESATHEQTAEQALHRLRNDAELNWVRKVVDSPDVVPATPEQMGLHLQRLLRAVERARDKVGHAEGDLLAVQGALESLAEALAKNRPPQEIETYVPALRQMYEHELEQRFSVDAIAEALFDGGTDIKLDLQERMVTWRASDDLLRSRPLEAFSSGERAFTYTLALLGLIENRPARNRVIALDEFGAYVARDRLSRLLYYINSNVIGKVAEQVLVVLPLAQDYGALQRLNGTSVDARSASRLTELEQRGYFTEPFELTE